MKRGEEVQAGSSIHIWLSLQEFVVWSKDLTTAMFKMEDEVQNEIVSMCADLVVASPVPVFVSLCTCSVFHGATELGIEKTLNRIAAVELAKVGVPTTANPLFWMECSNFIDGKPSHHQSHFHRPSFHGKQQMGSQRRICMRGQVSIS